MAEFVLVTIKVHDMAWVENYAANVPAIIRKHGGAYFAVSESIRRFEGDGPDLDSIVLLTFPSRAATEDFISDPDYAPYKAARLAATSGDMFAFTSHG
ncbi:DUF1330 domain-containing protein [Polymorphobacter sp. PAMC 29334]|uniref:DUF1330 domain-containing protein n=1 Tax=Polymorphobacter sp. PAMC 29334 TaxID=2862331 RepID=UPI001C686CC0|nr:DUF1330 domain-containing protein [Polymorphobacter sp. PAMC 29334]QYE34034.1 DUF1330 domain-containing protein [Polymorphobacter sp. PAMC 29334]